MSHIVSLAKVNQFLPNEKMEVLVHDTIQELETTARDIVFGQLSTYFDTSAWATPATTPSMVSNILGLLVAGWVYTRQFSEESTEDNSYGENRVQEAYRLLEGVIAGEYSIGSTVLVDATATGEASVYETEPIFSTGSAF